MCVCVCVCVCRIGAHTVHRIAMKLSQVDVNMPAVVLEIKSCTSLSTQCCPFPIGAHTVCPIAFNLHNLFETCSRWFWKFNIYKNQCLCVCVSVCRIGAHTVHPMAMKLSQVVVKMPVVVLEI